MKRKIYIVTLILFAAVFFAPAVKAENKAWNQDYSYGTRGNGGDNGYNNNRNSGPATNPSNNGAGTTASGNPSPSSANLPINGGVVFLFVAGMVIGVVTLKKFKTLKPALAA